MEIPFNMTTVLLAVPLFLYIYLKLREKYNFWNYKNVIHEKPVPFVGNYLPLLTLKSSMKDIYDRLYFSYPNEKYVGLYEFVDPTLIIRDPELIECILIKDFKHFTDQIMVANDGGIFTKTLFQLNGDIWRSMRYKMKYCLSNKKLKTMFDYMLESNDTMVKYMEQNYENKDLKIGQILGTLNADISAGCVFGLKLDLKENEIFQEMNREIFDINVFGIFRILMLLCTPRLANLLGLTFMPKHVDKYWRQLIKVALNQPKSSEEFNGKDKTKHVTNVAELLVALKEQGFIEKRSKENDNNEPDQQEDMAMADNIEITDDILNGQVFQFLAGGFEPINNSLIYTMFELAKNPEIQDKLRQEIKEVITSEGYTFESLKKMTYLEQVIKESLRIYPLLPFLTRICSKRYTTSDGRLQIDKGQKILIPITAIHNDPQYYSRPNEFNPDRFHPDNKIIGSSLYFPFGGGPRICLGKEFSLMEMRLILAKFIENFKFTLSPQTKLPLEFNKQAFFVKPKYPIYLRCHKV